MQPKTQGALNRIQQWTRHGIRSVAQARAFLAHHGFEQPEIDQAIAQAQAADLLDDAACTRLWMDAWQRRGYSWAMIAERLKAKGIPESLLPTAASEVLQEHEQERAWNWLRQRILGVEQVSWDRWRRALARRGYSESIVDAVIERAKKSGMG